MGTHTQVPNGSFTAPNAKTFRGTESPTVSDDSPGSPESRIPYKPRAGQDAGLLVILGPPHGGCLSWPSRSRFGQPPRSSAPFPDDHLLPLTWPFVCSKFHRSFES